MTLPNSNCNFHRKVAGAECEVVHSRSTIFRNGSSDDAEAYALRNKDEKRLCQRYWSTRMSSAERVCGELHLEVVALCASSFVAEQHVTDPIGEMHCARNDWLVTYLCKVLIHPTLAFAMTENLSPTYE